VKTMSWGFVMVDSKHRSEKLYNAIFPLWLLWVFPPFILVTVPLNWIWDATVLGVTLLILKRKDLFSWRLVAKVFGIGYLSDFIATGFLFVMMMWVPYVRNYHYEICYAPFRHWCSAVVMIAALMLAASCICFLNYFLVFKKMDMPPAVKWVVCVSLAVFTTPYLFLIPKLP